MPRHLLLTGASGTLGRMLADRLCEAGYRLRLSDIAPFPARLPDGADFIRADLADARSVERLVAGTDAVLHFGGISAEGPYRSIFEANIIGTTHVFEAARAERQRVISASSNHVVGYYPRGERLNVDDPARPDGYYGLSKAYGELLGRVMFDKYGVESVHLRIGSCVPAPTEARHLSTWLSYDDLVRLVIAAVEAPKTGCAIVWGVSANPASWWAEDDAALIGYRPQDDASRFGPLPDPGDETARRFQGGTFAADGYRRDG